MSSGQLPVLCEHIESLMNDTNINMNTIFKISSNAPICCVNWSGPSKGQCFDVSLNIYMTIEYGHWIFGLLNKLKLPIIGSCMVCMHLLTMYSPQKFNEANMSACDKQHVFCWNLRRAWPLLVVLTVGDVFHGQLYSVKPESSGKGTPAFQWSLFAKLAYMIMSCVCTHRDVMSTAVLTQGAEGRWRLHRTKTSRRCSATRSYIAVTNCET